MHEKIIELLAENVIKYVGRYLTGKCLHNNHIWPQTGMTRQYSKHIGSDRRVGSPQYLPFSAGWRIVFLVTSRTVLTSPSRLTRIISISLHNRSFVFKEECRINKILGQYQQIATNKERADHTNTLTIRRKKTYTHTNIDGHKS